MTLTNKSKPCSEPHVYYAEGSLPSVVKYEEFTISLRVHCPVVKYDSEVWLPSVVKFDFKSSLPMWSSITLRVQWRVQCHTSIALSLYSCLITCFLHCLNALPLFHFINKLNHWYCWWSAHCSASMKLSLLLLCLAISKVAIIPCSALSLCILLIPQCLYAVVYRNLTLTASQLKL